MKITIILLAGIVCIQATYTIVRAQVKEVPPSTVRWEYGEFGSAIAGGKNNAGGFFWVSPVKTTEPEKWEDLYKELGGKGVAPNGQIDFFNLLGSQGWEFVCFEKDGTAYFKRRAQ